MTVPPKETSMKQTIALVDDDRNILTSVQMTLEQEGFQVRTYTDGESALQGLNARPVDLAVLDIKMPRMDGMELLQRLRQRSSMPVIFLTSKDEEVDELMGLRLGADDYITKPFSQRLLIERIRALLRRNEASRAEGSGAAPGGVMVRGELTLDETKHQCIWHGEDIQLTVTEFLLVKALAARPGMVKSRDQLIDAAYGENIYVDDRTIDSHVKRIRKKFRTGGRQLQPHRDALRHRLPLQGALIRAPCPTAPPPSPRWPPPAVSQPTAVPRSAGCRRCCAASCWSTRCRWRCWWRRCCISTSTRTGCWRPRSAALREQARIYAGALGESAVRTTDPDNPKLVPEIARPLLRRLTEPTPGAQAKLYAPDGTVVADSRVREGPSGAVNTEPLPPAGGARAVRRRDRLDLRQGAGAAAARDADAAGGRHDARAPAGSSGSRT